MISLCNKKSKSSNYKQKLGAVIVKSGRVMSFGYNQTGRNTTKLKQSWEGSIHAEEHAIINFLKKHPIHELIGSIMYISRTKKDGSSGLAKPCSHCHSLLEKFQFKKIIYSTENGLASLTFRK